MAAVCTLGLAVPATGAAWPVFAPLTNHPTGGRAAGVAIADVTGDGRQDVLVATDSAILPSLAWKLLLFTQNADGSLAAPTSHATHGDWEPGWIGFVQNMGVATGDVNGDAKTDVAVATSAGIDLFFQQDGALAPAVLVSTSAAARQVEIGDLDGDGRTDLAVHVRGGIKVLWNEGAGVFAEAGVFAGEIGPAGSTLWGEIEIGDVTSDGRLDIVAFGAQTVRVFASGPGRTFSQIPYAILPETDFGRALALGDVTGDGRPDVVAASAHLWILPQTAEGGLGAPILRPEMGGSALELGDVDGDGLLDIVTSSGAFTVVRQEQGGTFAATCSYPGGRGGWTPNGLGLGDANGDGLLDVVLSGDELIAVVRRLPNGSKTPTSTSLSGTPTPFIFVGETLTLSGVVGLTNGGCRPGGSVEIIRVRDGVETVVGHAPLDPSGGFTFAHAPTLTGPSTFRAVWSGDVGSEPSASAPVFVNVNKRGTALTLAASAETVTFNDRVTLTATLNGGPADAVVTINEIVDGTTRPIASGSVDGARKLSVSIVAKQKATYEAVFAETDEFWGSRSAKKLVRVKALLEARMVGGHRNAQGVTVYRYTSACVTRGRNCPTFAVRVRPPHPAIKVQVTFQVRTPIGWYQVFRERIRTKRDGSLVLIFRYANRNVIGVSGRLRVYFPGDAHHGKVQSPWVRFKVRG